MKILKISAAIVLALSVSACFENIETGNVGVSSFMGQTNPEPLMPGTYQTFTRSIYEVSGKIINVSFDKLHPKSFDNLSLDEFDVDVLYQIDVKRAPALSVKYQNDMAYRDGAYLVADKFVTKQAMDAVFSGVAQFNANTMHTKRDDIAKAIHESLQHKLDVEVGKDWISVRNVNIRKIITDKTQEENIRKISAAKFAIDQKIAENEAEEKNNMVILTQASGRAAANAALSKSITPELLKMRELDVLEKFAQSGTHTVLLPQGGGAAPLINVK